MLKISGAKPCKLPEIRSQPTRGPPTMKPTPDVITRPPAHRSCSQSADFPPTSTPSTAPASAQGPYRALNVGTDRPCTRSMNVAAQALRPFTANVTNAPPRNTQMSVGVRRTTVAASRNSSNADAATSPAAAVRRTATGTRRATVQTNPAATNTPNTAIDWSNDRPTARSST